MSISGRARAILKWATRGVSFDRRLPARFGRRKVAVSPDSTLRYLFPTDRAFDPTLLAMADTLREGMVVWDIGANIGDFVFSAAHMTKATVVAVEPDPFLIERLMKSVAYNPDLDVRVFQAAISDCRGTAKFLISRQGRASNQLWFGDGASPSEFRCVMTVETTTLDDLLSRFPAPDFIKIDIEHAELIALRSARSIIQDVRPILYVEVSGDNYAPIHSLLSKAGYNLEGNYNVLATPRRSARGADLRE